MSDTMYDVIVLGEYPDLRDYIQQVEESLSQTV